MNDKEIFIHIGMPKAASSSLEENIFHKMEGVFHFSRSPVLRKAVNQIQGKLPFAVDHEALKNEVREELKGIKEKKILITSENFVGEHSDSFIQFHYIKENLKRVFPRASVLLIIRRQDKVVESVYKRMVKRGLNKPFLDFVNYSNGKYGHEKLSRVGYRDFFNVQNLNYGAIMQEYQEVYGRANVHVIPFELLKRDEKRFLREFYDWIGGEGPLEMGKRNVKGLNQGYSKRAMKMAKFINPFFRTPYSRFGIIPINPGFQKLKNKERKSTWDKVKMEISRRIDPMHWLSSRSVLKPHQIPELFSEEQFCELMKMHQEGNRYVEKETGRDLHQFGYFVDQENSK